MTHLYFASIASTATQFPPIPLISNLFTPLGQFGQVCASLRRRRIRASRGGELAVHGAPSGSVTRHSRAAAAQREATLCNRQSVTTGLASWSRCCFGLSVCFSPSTKLQHSPVWTSRAELWTGGSCISCRSRAPQSTQWLDPWGRAGPTRSLPHLCPTRDGPSPQCLLRTPIPCQDR